jgi:hypothetical protein
MGEQPGETYVGHPGQDSDTTEEEGASGGHCRQRSSSSLYEEMLANAAKVGLKRSPPVIESTTPGSLHLYNPRIYELIDFP